MTLERFTGRVTPGYFTFRAGRRIVRPLLVVAFLTFCLLPASAYAQTTALVLDSQPGDPLGAGIQRTDLPATGATFQASVLADNTVSVTVTAASSSWDFRFRAANSVPLQAGQYFGVARYPFYLNAAMNVSKPGSGGTCNTVTGRYWVREIVLSGSTVQKLAIDFEQHCSDANPALFGAIRYSSTIASLIPFDGNYPRYRLDVPATVNGAVTGGEVDCHGAGPVCTVDYAQPQQTVTLAANPDAGFYFTGWNGSCHGARTTTFRVNTLEQCGASFTDLNSVPSRLLMLNSQRGDYVGQGKQQILNESNAVWQAWTGFGTVNGELHTVNIAVRALGGDFIDSYVGLAFGVPNGAPVAPGTYEGVRFGDSSRGYIDVGVDSNGCNQTRGTFTVHEIETTGTTVTKLALDFEHHCEGVSSPPKPLLGSLRINSSVPPHVALAVVVDAGGRVDLSPSGQSCTVNCTAMLDLGTVVTMTPVPAAGQVFAGWRGDPDCTDGVVSMVAPVACEALFDSVITVDLVTPASGSGTTQIFTLDSSSSIGGSDVATVWVWFTPAFSGSSANSCLLYYERATSGFHLVNDAGTAWGAGPAGVAITLQNTQCSIALGTSGATIIGNTLRVTVHITFKAAAVGTREIWMYATSATGSNSGWQEKGAWTTPASVVTADAVSPASGAGARKRFALTYSDSFGGSSLTQAWVWFTPSFNASSAANSCLAYYERATNKLFLLNDAGTTWASASVVIGSVTTLQNSQCSFSLPDSGKSVSSNSLTVTLDVRFQPSYAGAQQIWMYATNGTQASGWQQRGTWTAQVPLVTVGTPTPASGTGTTQLFSLPFSSNLGLTDVTAAYVWFNATHELSSTAGSCLVLHLAGTNFVFLRNDAGTAWQSATLGSATTLQNSQCSIAMGSSRVPTSFGDTYTLQLAMTFKPAFGGAKNIYMYTFGNSGASSGWQDRGDWIVPSPVAADAVTPDAGNTPSQTFALSYSSTSGADSLTSTWVWFNATLAQTAAASCLAYYEPGSGLVYLLNDAGTVWQSALIGTATTLQNSQCALNLAGSQAVPSGNTLTLTLDVTFKVAFAGTKNIYLYGSMGPANSGWQDRGDWVVPSAVTPVSATPDSGNASSTTFALMYASVNGASDVTTAWVWFNPTLAQTAAASCLVYYDQPTNQLFLLNDAGTIWQSATPGAGTLQNAQCSIDLALMSIVQNGMTLTIDLPVTFTSSGARNIYMYAANGQTASGWQDLGDWTVP